MISTNTSLIIWMTFEIQPVLGGAERGSKSVYFPNVGKLHSAFIFANAAHDSFTVSRSTGCRVPNSRQATNSSADQSICDLPCTGLFGLFSHCNFARLLCFFLA